MSDAITRLNAALEGRYAIERELGEWIGVSGIHLFCFVGVDRAHERRHARAHANTLLAQVIGVIQVAEPPGAGKYDGTEEPAECKLIAHSSVSGHDFHWKFREVEHMDDTVPHGKEEFFGSDLPDDINKTHHNDDDEKHDAALHRCVDHFRAEEDGGDRRKNQCGP